MAVNAALVDASMQGNLDGVVKSLNDGANIDGKYLGYTALMRAAEKGDMQIVELLIMRGADIQKAEYTIRGMADLPGGEASHGYKDGYGYTALMLAAKNGHDKVVELLLRHGANVDAVDFTKHTALHHTTNGPITTLLLEKKANMEIRHSLGMTPLFDAISSSTFNYSDKIKQLIKHKADIYVKFAQNDTLLHIAASSGHFEIIPFLIEKGLNPNVRNDGGLTPLHFAALYGKTEVARMLLKHGAIPTLLNKGDRSPLDLAKEWRFSEIVAIFEEELRKKSTPDRGDGKQSTPGVSKDDGKQGSQSKP